MSVSPREQATEFTDAKYEAMVAAFNDVRSDESHRDMWQRVYLAAQQPAPVAHADPEHVCGMQGYNGMIDPPCPACERNRQRNIEVRK